MRMLTPEELVDLEVSGWKPEPGDKLVGVIVDRENGVESGWAPYTCLTIQTSETTATRLHCFHGVLRGMVDSKNPQVGDQIAVKYLGFKATPEGKYKGFEGYTTVIRKPAASAPAETSRRPFFRDVPEDETPMFTDSDIPF